MSLNKVKVGALDSDGNLVKDDSDLDIVFKSLDTLPFLTFPDSFIDNKTILTETVDNLDMNHGLYNGDIELKKLVNLESKVAGLYSLYFVPDTTGYVTTMPVSQTVTSDYLKGLSVNSKVSLFPAVYDNVSNQEVLSMGPNRRLFNLATPDTDFGDTVTIKTIELKGVKVRSIPNRHKLDIDGGSLYNEESLLPLLVLDTSAFTAWDPKELPFHTLLQTSNGFYSVMYVGSQDVDKIYIPLI